MTRLHGWFLRIGKLVRRTGKDHDLREQIRGHLEEATEEYVDQGWSPDEARRRALIDFGSTVRAEEACRDVRGRWFQDIRKDIGYGFRSLGRNRGFAIVGVASLAFGIGANTLIFSIVNSFLLRPRPVADPDRLVGLYVGTRDHPYETTSYLVVRQGMVPVALGLGLGLLVSFGATRVLASPMFETDLLYGVSSQDPLTFADVHRHAAFLSLMLPSPFSRLLFGVFVGD